MQRAKAATVKDLPFFHNNCGGQVSGNYIAACVITNDDADGLGLSISIPGPTSVIARCSSCNREVGNCHLNASTMNVEEHICGSCKKCGKSISSLTEVYKASYTISFNKNY